MSISLELKKAVFRVAPSLSVVTAEMSSPLRRSEIQLVRTLGADAAAALDIGASWGLFTLVLAKAARRVDAFEPNPEKVSYLESLGLKNCQVHGVALSDHVGEADLVFPRRKSAFATIEAANPAHAALAADTMRIAVPKRPLDSFGLNETAFIKIDVEGHEWSVLKGAENMLRGRKPVLYLEIEQRHNPAAFEEVFRFLQTIGYEAYYVSQFKIGPISAFDVERDQIDDDDMNERMARGEYIYNFLFVPDASALGKLAAAGFERV